MLTNGATGRGIATLTDDGTVLEAAFFDLELGEPAGLDNRGTERLADSTAPDLFQPPGPGPDPARGVVQVAVRTVIGSLAEPPVDAFDVYLRLQMLSRRLLRPNDCNLDGVFGLLANVVWTNHGPCPVDGFDLARARLRSRGPVTVFGVDKFPRMVDHVVPSGVRIADADRVRLGAHLAAGTTVMHEGFVNFNAGTLGACMIEGRISAGVVVGDGSDIGGRASLLGTLSRGGQGTVSVGRRCPGGAHAGRGRAGRAAHGGALARVESAGRTRAGRALPGCARAGPAPTGGALAEVDRAGRARAGVAPI